MSTLDDAFVALMGNEGALSMNSADPGNWTGGKVGVGILKGTKYGIAASQHPNEDIKNLTLDRAKYLFKTEYWDPLHLDEFDGRIAFQMADANFNGGYTVKWAQAAAGAEVDGKMGPATIAAIKAADPEAFVLRFLAYRLKYLTGLKTWPTFGRGWSNRIASNMLIGAT